MRSIACLPRQGLAHRCLVDATCSNHPNGLCFSPDRKRLYVNDTRAERESASFDV